MKKKLISSIACFALLVVMFIGSSIAWFTDSASSVNTMVAGKISIQQDEIYDQNSVMLPNVEIPKVVTVTNNGNQPAYVRTLFAFEDTEDGSVLEMVQANAPVTITFPVEPVQFKVTVKDQNGQVVSDTCFTVGYYVYDSELAVNGTYQCLTSIKLKPEANGDWMENVNEKYELVVLSQASQTTGLEGGPINALNTAFGEITAEKCAVWFQYVLEHTTGYVPDGYTVTAAVLPTTP